MSKEREEYLTDRKVTVPTVRLGVTVFWGALRIQRFITLSTMFLSQFHPPLSISLRSIDLDEKYLLRVRGGADKSLARPGRKQATATKLGIYSTHYPRSSIHFLARCSNFCKPLKKKLQKVVRPTSSPRQQ